MIEFLIGCGGWAYFKVPGLRPLEAYARAFTFAEVNSTFYRIPDLKTVEAWRQRVPPDFEFAVRCYKDVTHIFQLEPAEEALRAFSTMIEICNTLKSSFLVLQTPSEIEFNQEKIRSIGDFFESADMKGVRAVWEIKRKGGEPIPPKIVALMNDKNIIHCADFSKETPVTKSNTVYTRVFGKGEHNLYQFTDDELLAIDKRIAGRDSKTAAISFHNVRMYKDAARFKIYKETGRFSTVTGAEGQESLRKVLREDASFPTTKRRLLKDQGWKIIDLTRDKRVHVRVLLERLPDEKFRNLEEVLRYAKRLIG